MPYYGAEVPLKPILFGGVEARHVMQEVFGVSVQEHEANEKIGTQARAAEDKIFNEQDWGSGYSA